MNYENPTQRFIRIYKGTPASALANLNKYAMQHQLFDSKRAAESTGLIFNQSTGHYEVRTPYPVDKIMWQLNCC